MYIAMMQHPVGRGGLFSGYVDTGHRAVHWVYDCGSLNKKSELDRGINIVSSVGNVDVLFISHLDDDHVNGIDRLLSLNMYCGKPIRTVVLPYFSIDISLGIMAKSGSQKSLSSSFIQMNEDMEQWFASRGVENIIYVDSNGEGNPIPLIESFDGEGDDGGPTLQLGRRTIVLDQTTQGPITTYHEPDADISIAICNKRGKNAFVLIPYAYKPKDHLMARFKNELNKVFRSADRATIISAAKTDLGRSQLKSCYGKIWKTHNLLSMSLYCGPVFKSTSKSFLLYGDNLCKPADIGGWMLTGDSNLKGDDRREKFLRYYGHYIPNVISFMLPHHGSRGSFKASLLSSFFNSGVFYATANHKEKKFPHPTVERLINMCNRDYRTVETCHRSRILLVGSII